MEVTQNHDEASVYVPSHGPQTRPELALAESGTTKRWNIFLDAASCLASSSQPHVCPIGSWPMLILDHACLSIIVYILVATKSSKIGVQPTKREDLKDVVF